MIGFREVVLFVSKKNQKNFLSMVGFGLLLHLAPQVAHAQGFTSQQRTDIIAIIRQAMKDDPTILKDAIGALQQDEARTQQSAISGLITDLSDALLHNPADPVAGNPKGDVTLVEFFDVRCPYCRRMLPVFEQLLKADGNIRVVYKDLPVLGPGSVAGAKALMASQNQGGYSKLHALLMAANPVMDEATIKAASDKAGLDWARLKRDMEAPEIKARIDANLALSHQLDIQGTPAYIIGTRLLPGAVDLAELQDAVAAARKK
jgi:protein-disulfide isomerase